MAGVVEFCGLNVLLMQGSGYQCVDLVFPQRLYGSVQGAHGIFSAYVVQLTRGNSYLFLPTVVDIDLLMVDLIELFQALVVEGQIRDGLAVKIDDLVGSK